MLDLRLENIALKQQGLFSRPFAEVIVNPPIISKPSLLQNDVMCHSERREES